MNAPRDIRDSQGKPISLGSMLGKGGEGIVFEVSDKVAAKLYHPDKASERAEKINAMVAAGWHAGSGDVAYPIESLFKPNKTFVGFTMRRVGGRKPVHDLYSPASRKTYFPKANFPFLLHTSLNVSNALAGVHATGCVVGDINHSGVLVAPDAMTTLIDCDSFQVNTAGRMYLCKVGVPDFTPPELQGKRLDQTIRTENHDAFGLGVLLFNLLFLGRHPFAGKFLGKGDMPMETAIAQYRFAYSARRSETQMEPPPGVPTLDDIPQPLAQAFEKCFGKASASGGRPKASEWASLLKAVAGDLVVCKNSGAHHYFKNARTCPWCRMEQTYPGFLAFVPPVIVTGPAPTNLGQLVAAIRGVADPGQPPPLSAQMPAFTPQTATPPSIKSNPKFRYYGLGLLGCVLSLQFFYLSPPGPLLGLAGLATSGFLALRNSLNGAGNNNLNQLRQSWSLIEERWRTAGNTKFLDIRRGAEDDIRQMQNLGAEESAKIAELRTKLRDMQLHRFLDNYQIAHAKIKGLGSTRKATLRSYGIETAADVQAGRIKQIGGFGPSITGLLIAWRTSIEKRFVFNPAQPINPADVARVQMEIARKRIDLQASLQKALTDLRSASGEIQTLRNGIKASGVQHWNRLKQAENDSKQLSFFGTNRPAWTLAIIVLIALLITSNIRSIPKNHVSTTALPPVTTSSREVTQEVSRPQMPSVNIPSANAVIIQPKEVVPPNPKEPVHDDAQPAKLPNRDTVASITVEKPPTSLAPQASPTEAERAQNNEVNSVKNQQDVAWLQEKLRLAGFLKSPSNGSWDAATKSALLDFKVTNGLAADDILDSIAAAKLNQPTQLRATQSFIGGWSSEPRCPNGVELEVSAKRAAVPAGACEFSNVLQDRSGWRIRASCRVAENTWPANIRLQVSSDRMVWSSERGQATYYRCR
jgi:DNA-binding helix-hairpin-helix protein with protein kinase domain